MKWIRSSPKPTATAVSTTSRRSLSASTRLKRPLRTTSRRSRRPPGRAKQRLFCSKPPGDFVARPGHQLDDRSHRNLDRLEYKHAQPLCGAMELRGDARQAEAPQPGHGHVEHVGLGGEVEEQLIGGQADFTREPSLHALEQIGVARWPVGRLNGKLGSGNVERAFGEAAVAQRARESRVIVLLQLVAQSVVGQFVRFTGTDSPVTRNTSEPPLPFRTKAMALPVGMN